MSANLYNDAAGVFNGSPTNNLPKGLSGFLGRESEILQIKRLLSQKRLVTLSGVNGVGKTRLAIRVADELAGQFSDGVFLLPLDSIVLPEIFLDTLAFTLGIPIDPRSNSTEQFLAALTPKNLLLILDGFEHVPQHASLVAEIKARAPQVKCLVTTSEPLDLANESVLELQGLDTPSRNDAEAEASPSVQLFLQHARVYPDFELDLEAIGHICRLLDGVPLAIELAASWTTILPCEQIAQRMEQGLALHPPDNISGELQSMLAVFDAIWNLLAENEKRILMGLSIFKGSFSHQAASKITGASYYFIDELLNKRIIRRVSSQRYSMHVAFANFLQDKLQENPVLATDIEIRHGSFFLGLLRDSEYALKHSASSSALEEIIADAANIRLAWKRTVAAGNLRLTQSALTAWIMTLESHGWLHEAIRALESLGTRLSESYDAVPDAALSYLQVQKFLADIHYKLGDHQAGIRELESALQRIEGRDIPEEEAEVYRSMGDHYQASGHSENARNMYRHALVFAEKTGDLLLIYETINSLAEQAYLAGDYQGAVSTVEHALEIARELGDKERIAQSDATLGRLYYKLNDYQRAETLLSEALSLAPDVKGQVLKISIFELLGKNLTAAQDYRQAFRAFVQGLRLLKDNDSPPLAVAMLAQIAELLSRTKEKPLALSLVKLLMNHGAASKETRTNLDLLHEALTAENIQPEKRDWEANQLHPVVVDLIPVLDEKAAGK